MCVICYKNYNQKLPSKNLIVDMWNKNPDGAGIMWKQSHNSPVEFKKGFMNLNDFLAFLDKNNAKLSCSEVAMHFRITTHGGTSAGNTHPFVCDKGVDSHQLNGKMSVVIMHNGVLPITPRKKDISDSAELALRSSEHNPYRYICSLDEFYGNSKVIVFAKSKETKLLGAAWKEDGGLKFSNLNHVKQVWTPKNKYPSFQWFDYTSPDYEVYYDWNTHNWRYKKNNKVAKNFIYKDVVDDDDKIVYYYQVNYPKDWYKKYNEDADKLY